MDNVSLVYVTLFQTNQENKHFLLCSFLKNKGKVSMVALCILLVSIHDNEIFQGQIRLRNKND